MNTIKTLGFTTLAASALFAAQAFATTCPVAPATGTQTLPGPVCIAPDGLDGAGTGLVNILAGPGSPDHNSSSVISSGPGVNPYTDQTVASYWTIGGSGAGISTVMLQIAGYAENYTFGIFSPGDTSNTLALFTPGTTNGATTMLQYNWLTGVYTVVGANNATATFNSANFGFFLTTPEETFYSDPTLNSDGRDHQVAYKGDGQNKLTYAGGQIHDAKWLPNEFIMAWEDLPFGSSDLDYNDFVVMVESITPVPEPAALAVFGFGVLLIGGCVALRRRRCNG